MRYLLLIFSFFITGFGQPAWISGFGILSAALGYGLFWQGMLAFPKMRDRFFISSLWFACVQAVQFSWIATPDYMGPLIVFFYLFLIICMGIQFGIISSFIEKNASWPKCLAISGGWVICEGLRLFFLCGCTWNPVGLALACNSYSLQFASVFGIFGLSFWVILVNLAFLKNRLTSWGILALFPYLFGLAQQTWVEKYIPVSKTLQVALIQTNLAPEEKEFDPKNQSSFVDPFIQWGQTLRLLESKKGIDLVIMPEAAFPLGAHSAIFDLSEIKTLLPEESFPPLKRPYAVFLRDSWKVSHIFITQALSNRMNADVIVGLDDRDFTGKYNAAFYFHPQNLHYQRYEKQILAPMGEYIPLAGVRWFARFVGDQLGIHSSFDSGKEGKIFHSHVPIGISICLEETFSGLMRDLRTKGAEAFVSISNDAYFPNTKLAKQHFHHGRVRAAENGIPLLRSCNSGITGGVDCFGRPFNILESKEKTDVLFFSFPIRSFKTFYTFWGDRGIFSLSALFICSFLLFQKKKLL